MPQALAIQLVPGARLWQGACSLCAQHDMHCKKALRALRVSLSCARTALQQRYSGVLAREAPRKGDRAARAFRSELLRFTRGPGEVGLIGTGRPPATVGLVRFKVQVQ